MLDAFNDRLGHRFRGHRLINRCRRLGDLRGCVLSDRRYDLNKVGFVGHPIHVRRNRLSVFVCGVRIHSVPGYHQGVSCQCGGKLGYIGILLDPDIYILEWGWILWRLAPLHQLCEVNPAVVGFDFHLKIGSIRSGDSSFFIAEFWIVVEYVRVREEYPSSDGPGWDEAIFRLNEEVFYIGSCLWHSKFF